MRASVRIAGSAKREYLADHPDAGRSLWVAASVGPYGARLANGAEYTGRYGLSAARLKARHRPEFEVLASSGPDVLACETIPDLAEAEALAELIDEHGRPGWLSFTINGFRTAAGQRLDEAFGLAGEVDNVIAVGVNCCNPDNLADIIRLAREASGKPVIVYPNSGETWDHAVRHWTGHSRYRPDDAAGWVTAGASAVGGCCRVHPQHIRGVADVLAR